MSIVRLAANRAFDLLAAGLILTGLGLAYARTLAPGITWANSATDSGDLVAAAATLGVAHPSGYPTYLVLARLFQAIPLGDLAFRTNLFSAAAALFATLGVYAIVRELCPSQGWRSPVAAGLAALALGLSPVFWSQAVVAEVYSLNALFAAAILLFTAQTLRPRRAMYEWTGRLQALVAGLALGNHLTIALIVAAWLVAVGVSAPGRARMRQLGWRLILIGVGLLVYLYLPLRAATHPAVNWGDPRDWAGFWWVVSGQPYRQLAFGLPPTFLYSRVAAWANLLAQQFGWVGLGLGFFGLLYSSAETRLFVWLTAVIAVLYSIFAIAYNTADSYAYLIPAYLIFAIWVGLAISALLESIGSWQPGAAPLAAALLVVALLWQAPATAREVDASRDDRATTYAAAVLVAAPEQAIVVTSSDRDTFPLWYYHYALGQRPDLFVIVAPLLEFTWYREHLRAVYPTLQIPERPGVSWVEAIAAAHQARGPLCRTRLDVTPPLLCDSP